MKICMIVNNTIVSDPRVKGEARVLHMAGHDVTVIGCFAKGLREDEIWEGIRFLRYFSLKKITKIMILFNALCVFIFNKYTLKQNYFLLRKKVLARKLVKKFRKEAYDVYHAHDLDTLEYAFICAKTNNSKLVYDSHELWVEWQRELGTQSFFCDLWEKAEKKIAPQADLVITVSDGIAAEIKENNNLNELPLVLYNCTDIKPYKRLNVLRKKYTKTADNRKIVLYQGHVKEGRGLSQMLNVAYLLPEIDFIIIGPLSD